MSIQPSDDREKASDETDPTQSPPEAFGGSEGHHLTVGMTGSGKSYSVARRARSWLSESADRTLVIVAATTSYNGLVGYSNGVYHDGMDLDQATNDKELIKPNGVTLIRPDFGAGNKNWQQALSQLFTRIKRFSESKSGETALIFDDLPVPTAPEYEDVYSQLLTGDVGGQVWRVTNQLAREPTQMDERGYINQFQAIDLFRFAESEAISHSFEIDESNRRYLLSEATVTRPRKEDGYSTGIGRSAPHEDWYRFVEDATADEHAMLDYRGEPLDFNSEGEL